MHRILELYKDTEVLAHAYLIVGDVEIVIKKVENIAEEIMGLPKEKNPDIVIIKNENFSVSESRKLKEQSSKKSFSGGKRIFILAGNIFTEESQNALLKILEEPIAGHHYFIVARDNDRIIPTLKSRLVVLKERKIGTKTEELCLKFISLSVPDRIFMVENEILKDDDNESSRGLCFEMISCFEKIIFEEYKKNRKPINSHLEGSLIIMPKIKSYLNGVSSSSKMILEYLSFFMPKIEL